MSYDPYARMAGGFGPNDGTIDFYLRVGALLGPDSVVLDLGAGRAAWFEEDRCATRRRVRLLKGKVAKVIAADIDEAVLANRASDERILIRDGVLDLPPRSVDLVVADYVLEHIERPAHFVAQIESCLKPGGWLCARTPHKYSYVAILSNLLKSDLHARILKHVQPGRQEADVFPTHYRMNTMRDLRRHFPLWDDFSFVFRANPSYYFGSRAMYAVQDLVHRLMWAELAGNIFLFVRRPPPGG